MQRSGALHQGRVSRLLQPGPPPTGLLCRGYRDVSELQAEAAGQGLVLLETIPMPANNFTLVMQKQP